MLAQLESKILDLQTQIETTQAQQKNKILRRIYLLTENKEAQNGFFQ